MKYYGGCDSGSTYTKCVILDETGKMVADVTLRSRINSVLSAQAALDEAVAQVPDLKSAKDLAYLVGTGYGRNKVPFADENISEISCHAMGVHVADPSVRSIIDIGGQDVKGIAVDTDGTVLNFAISSIGFPSPTSEITSLSANTVHCAVIGITFFARSASFENSVRSISNAFAIASKKRPVPAAHLSFIAKRCFVMSKKAGAVDRITLTGGCAKNEGLKAAIEKVLKLKVIDLPVDPQLIGAIGAAEFARQKGGAA